MKGAVFEAGKTDMDHGGEQLTDKKNLKVKQRLAGEAHDEKLVHATKVSEESDEHVCRICWGTDEEEDPNKETEDMNPLISPCKCAGTMGLIHLQCLRGWLETKRTRKVHGRQVIIKFKKLDCELCNTKFPYKITYNNQIVDIVGVEKPEKNYIILESLSNETQKIFHVIDTSDLSTYHQS